MKMQHLLRVIEGKRCLLCTFLYLFACHFFLESFYKGALIEEEIFAVYLHSNEHANSQYDNCDREEACISAREREGARGRREREKKTKHMCVCSKSRPI